MTGNNSSFEFGDDSIPYFFSKKTGSEEDDYNVVMHVHVNAEQQKPGKQKANEDNQDSTCSCSIF